jgi:hypothetical protein
MYFFLYYYRILKKNTIDSMSALCEKIKDSLDYAENYVEPQEEKNNEPPAQENNNQEEADMTRAHAQAHAQDTDLAQALAASRASMMSQKEDEDIMAQTMAASLVDNKKYNKREESKSELQKEIDEELNNDMIFTERYGKQMSKCDEFKFEEIYKGKILILGAHPTEKHIKVMTKENTNKFKSDTFTLSNWVDDEERTPNTDFFIEADLNNYNRLMDISRVQDLQFNRIIMDWSVLKGCYKTWIYANNNRVQIWNAIYNMLTDNGEIVIPRYLYLVKYDLSPTLKHQIKNLIDSKVLSRESANKYYIKSIKLQNMQRDNKRFDEFEEFIIKENKFDIKHCSVDYQNVNFPMQISVPNTADYANNHIKYFYVLTKK